MKIVALIAALAAPFFLATAARGDLPPEATGQVEQLAMPPNPHWVWVSDLILQRTALIDLDSGRFLGMINGGYGTIMPLFPARRDEIYLPATYYSRQTRGTRTDTVDIYDLKTLSPTAEVIIPSKRATNAVVLGHAALSDDDRFMAIFNWTTGTSLTIVDVERRTFTAEIATPGCSLVYGAGARRFMSICGDGTVFTVVLDDEGREVSRARSAAFFDPKTDPVTEKAVRYGNRWYFVSFDNQVYTVDVGAAEIAFAEPWSLVNDAERKDSWRIGGMQHLAVHQRSGRLYALMHQGGPDTHKEPGEEVWVFDLAARRRLLRVDLRSPGVTIYGFPVDAGGTLPWPLNRAADLALDSFAPAAVGFIQVTQDEQPLLFTASQFFGSLGVYDGLTGDFVRRVQPTGFTSDVLLAPWGRAERP